MTRKALRATVDVVFEDDEMPERFRGAAGDERLADHVRKAIETGFEHSVPRDAPGRVGPRVARRASAREPIVTGRHQDLVIDIELL